MSISYSKFFDPVQLGTSASTLLTIGAQPSQQLLRGGRIRFTNTTATAATVTAYAVPSGGSLRRGFLGVQGSTFWILADGMKTT